MTNNGTVHVGKMLKKNEEAVMVELLNPLSGMTSSMAQSIFDRARGGNYSQLQYIFSEIERTDPTLLVCVNRRASALQELGWTVVRGDERVSKDGNDSLAEDQIAFLESAIATSSNLPDAIGHLSLFAFRGFSHIQPIITPDLNVERFDLLDNWNFCYDKKRREWLWNPSASFSVEARGEGSGLVRFPQNEVVTVQSNTSIDWPALMIYLRLAVGERLWGQFLEQYGLPPVIVTMPEGESPDSQQEYADAAESIYRSRNGALPFGTMVSFAGDARGIDPFSGSIEHNMRLVVLMATGGTLTSLSEAGSGTLAGNAQMDVWRQIVKRDASVISNAIDKQLCNRLLDLKFPNHPHLAQFKLDIEPKPTPTEVLDLAIKASQAGLQMDVDELSKMTGYTLTRSTQNDDKNEMKHEVVPNDKRAVDSSNSETARDKVLELIQGLSKDEQPLVKKIEAILALPEEQQRDAATNLLENFDEFDNVGTDLALELTDAIAEAFLGVE